MRVFSPMINDITTDAEDPPKLKGDSSYNHSFWAVQKKSYPEVKPIILAKDSLEVFEHVKNLAQLQESWSELEIDENNLRLTAVAVTPILKFKDDLAIEVRSKSIGTTEIHMRSRSRLGKSDLGANAKRIYGFFSLVKKAIG